MLIHPLLSRLQPGQLKPKLLYYLKPLLKSPISWLILGSFVVTLGLVIYLCVFVFTRQPLKLKVIYQPDYLEVVDYDASLLGNAALLKKGTRILALDEIPIEQIVGTTSGPYRSKLLLYEAWDPRSEFVVPGNSVVETLHPGQVVLLWSVSAKVLTITTPAVPSNLMGVNSCNCPQQLELASLPLTTNTISWRLIIVFLLFLAFSFLTSGLVLYVLRPNQTITIVFTQFYNLVILQQISANAQPFQYGIVEKLVGIVTVGLLGAVFYHFVILFPDGQNPRNRVAKALIRFFYLVAGVLIIIRLYLNFIVPIQPTDATSQEFFRKLSYLVLLAFFTVALSTLVIKFIRSSGQTRLRFRLAIFSLVFAIAPPLLALAATFLFNSLTAFLNSYFGLFFIPAIFLPPAFTYAVLKNRLLGIDLSVRRFVVHLFLYVLILVGYFLVSTFLGLFTSGNTNLVDTELVGALLLSIMLIFLNRLRHWCLRLVDRAFQVDYLNYEVLSNKWNSKLVRMTDLSTIFKQVLRDLPLDYHYKQAQILLFQPEILQIIIGQTNLVPFGSSVSSSRSVSNAILIFNAPVLTAPLNSHSYSSYRSKRQGERGVPSSLGAADAAAPLTYHSELFGENQAETQELYQTLWSAQNKEELGLLRADAIPTKANEVVYQRLVLNQDFWRTLEQKSCFLLGEDALAEPIKQALAKTELKACNPELILPLRVGEEYYGALLLSQKISEYFPTQEELGHLSNLAGQIALALYNALTLDQALQLARKEEKLRYILQQTIENEHLTREDERRKLGEVLHNDLIPSVNFIRSKLNDFYPAEVNNLEDDAEFRAYIEQSLSELTYKMRGTIADFSLLHIKNLVQQLKILCAKYQSQYPQLTFNFVFEGDEQLLDEQLLDETAKTTVYRVIQEIVSNAIKHAQPKYISVLLQLVEVSPLVSPVAQEESAADSLPGSYSYLLELKVVDDGVGIDQTVLDNLGQLVADKHFGLSNLKWRLEKYQATLNFSVPENNRGTEFSTVLVLKRLILNNSSSPYEELFQKYGFL